MTISKILLSKMFSKILFVVAIALCVNAADISSLPADQKATICTKNTAFCVNVCLQKTLVNTCDSNSLVWDCQCQDNALPVSKHYFPIQAQQCVFETQQCRNACVTTGGAVQAIETCSNLCDQQFNCGNPTAGEQTNFSSGAPMKSSNGTVSQNTIVPTTTAPVVVSPISTNPSNMNPVNANNNMPQNNNATTNKKPQNGNNNFPMSSGVKNSAGIYILFFVFSVYIFI